MKSRTGKSKDASRRKFLKTAGKFAVYTPPALMVMSSPSVRSASSCNQGVGEPVNMDGCSPGKSGEVIMNDECPTAEAGSPCGP